MRPRLDEFDPDGHARVDALSGRRVEEDSKLLAQICVAAAQLAQSPIERHADRTNVHA